MVDALTAACLLIGAGFAFTGALGLVRLPDLYSRLHGPTKATTLGVGGMLVASVLYFSARGGDLNLRELLITLFLFLTAPISAHLLSRAALHLGVRSVTRPAEPPGAQGSPPR